MPPRVNWRSAVAFVHDLAAVAAAWALAYLFRLNFEPHPWFMRAMASNLVWIIPAQGLLFLWLGMYRGLWRFASLPDLRRIVGAATLGAMTIALVVYLLQRPAVPRSALILYPVLLAVLMGGSRMLYRAWKEGHLRRFSGDGRRVIVLGAGSSAANLLKSIGRSPEWHVVGLLDDDPGKARREIQGVRVLGKLADLPAIAAAKGVEVAVIAMPGQPHRVRRRAVDLCASASLPAMTVPSYEDLVSGKVRVSQLRRVELDDLLGRDPVALDAAGLRDWLSGRTVLVTGAGGSIGAELCRQILRFAPARLVALELSELALYSIEQEFGNRSGSTDLVYVIGDVKSAGRIEAVLTTYRPSVVFHAAAYKHVPLMEDDNAWQAALNNALGTRRVAAAAARHGAEKFVLISTDKAVNPTNVMGATKRLAELLCQPLSTERTALVAVRFGNVLGSTGSVIPKFRRQIAAGGPVTVTHPEMRRYFMSIPEAAQLVLQAGLMGRGGEIYVLDMGEPVKIADLARQMIRLSGLRPEHDIEIRFTGLRPGEKLYEELLHDSEPPIPTDRNGILLAAPRAVDHAFLSRAMDELAEAAAQGRATQAVAILARLVPEGRLTESAAPPAAAAR